MWADPRLWSRLLLIPLVGVLLALAGPGRAQGHHADSPPAVESTSTADEAPEAEKTGAWAQTVQLLQEPFVQDALKAALLVGVLCAFLGVFVVLKRIVFVGAALANVASLGAAVALTPWVIFAFDWVAKHVPALEPLDHFKPLVMALLFMLLAVAFFSQHRLSRRVPREAIIGTAYAAAAGITLIILSKVQSQGQHELDILQGNILGVAPQEITELSIAALVIGLIQVLFYKEFVLVSFDPEVARTLGYNSSGWELLWYLSLGVMIAVSIHVAGTVLVFAYLVLPAVTALLLSRRLGVVLLLSVLFAVLATLIGVLVSVSPQFDVPTSPAIVGAAAAIFVSAWLLKTGANAFRKAS